MSTADVGSWSGHDRDAAGPDLGALRQDEAGVQERRQDDRGELERPVADDELEGASHRRAAARGGAGDAADAGADRARAASARERGGSVGSSAVDAGSDPAHRPAAARPAVAAELAVAVVSTSDAGRSPPAAGSTLPSARRAPDRAPEAGHLAARRPGHRDRADRAAAAPDERSAALAGPEEPGRARLRQLGLVEVAPDPRALDEADLAALLADDDHDGVGLLGDPEGRPVARPEPLDLDRRLGQRQERARGDDLLAADDDRTVVEGGPGHEDRDQQVGRQVARGASPRIRRSPRARSHARSRSARRGPARPGRLAAWAISAATCSAVRSSAGENSQASEPTRPIRSRRAPELGLEDDHEGEHADDGARLEDLAQERQVEQSGGRVDRDEDADADDETYRPGPADQAGTASR